MYLVNKANPSGSTWDYEAMKITGNTIVQITTETLWDGTTGPCYRFNVFASGTPWQSPQTALSIDLFECAVAANSQVTVTMYTKVSSGSGHKMQMRLDTSTTDIGIDDDITTLVWDGSSTTSPWTAYNLTFTPTKSGVARIKLDYWTTIQSSGVYIYFGGITVT